ncbi:MAG: hypothetical protein J0M04_23520 [Verrucomicrobia bacterium]|nr:hypothetical protein [Verrucomicrobiota bacterium]
MMSLPVTIESAQHKIVEPGSGVSGGQTGEALEVGAVLGLRDHCAIDPADERDATGFKLKLVPCVGGKRAGSLGEDGVGFG